MSEIKQVMAHENRHGMVCNLQTEDGYWYRISAEDFERLRKTDGRGCLQITVLPGHSNMQAPQLNIRCLQREQLQTLEARIAKAKTEIAALTEKLTALQKMLSEVA